MLYVGVNIRYICLNVLSASICSVRDLFIMTGRSVFFVGDKGGERMIDEKELDHSRRYAAPVTERNYIMSAEEYRHALEMAAANPNTKKYKLRIVIDEETGRPVYVAKCCRLPLGEERRIKNDLE